jgi:hypothetical protein
MNCSQKKIVRSSNKEITMAVPAMAAMIATSAARSAAAKNAQEETSKKKTTAKRPAPAKMPAMSGPMRRKTIETLKQDAKNALPKGPAKPNTMKKAPATGMKTTAKKAAAKPMAKPATKAPAKTITKAPARTPAKTPVKMTPQDAAMKKILEKKYGKIYG